MKQVVTALLIFIALASCAAPQTQEGPVPLPAETPQADMPNPASVYCEEQGHRLEIRTASDGSQTGYCIFPDGSECDEWAYFRGECEPAGTTTGELVIETYELIGRPDVETVRFTSVDGRTFTAADFEISTPFPSNQLEGTQLRFTATLDGDTLVAEQYSQSCNAEDCITVTRNGAETFRTDAGGVSPIPPLQGLWTYDDHWVLETNLFLEDKPFNGQILVDGTSLNQQNGYEESFNFQTIEGRPFYFFRRNGRVDSWFDGREIPLGYEDVPHYLCCGDSGFNPRARQGAVMFFANNADTWYFVRIIAPGVLK
jgi:putative hemolysin